MSESTLESVEVDSFMGKPELTLNWSNDRRHAMLLPIGKSKLHLCKALYRLIFLIEDDIELEETFKRESN